MVPSDPLPHEKMAEILEVIGRHDLAAKQFFAAGEIYVARKDLQRAIPSWELAARDDPSLPQAHMRLAVAYERAPETHRKAIYEYLYLAYLLQQVQQPQRAEQALQRALNLDPFNPDARNALDDVKHNKPIEPVDPDQYVQRLVSAPPRREEKPTSPEEALIDSTDTDEVRQRTPVDEAARYAMGLLADSIWSGAVPQAAQAPLLQAIDAHQVGDVDAAIDDYTEAIEAGLSDPGVLFCLGVLYLHSHLYEDAIAVLNQTMNVPDYVLASRLMLGEAYYAQDKLLDSTENLIRALRAADEGMNPLVDEGGYDRVLSSLTEQPEERLTELAKSLTFYLNTPDWRKKLHDTLEGYERRSKTSYVQDLTELILEGGRPEVAEIMQRVDMYFERDQIGLAVEEAYYAIERVPDYLPVHRRLADILIHQSRTQEAAVKINLVANTYLVRGNADKAADLFAEVIELWPADTEARLRVIDMMRNQGRVSEALHHYAELADLYYRLMADPEKAMATYEEALEYSRRNNAQPESLVPIFKAMADLERQRLNWRKALSYYERIRELDSSDEDAAMAVVELYFQLGDTTKAIGALDDFMRYLLKSEQADRLVPTLEDQVRRRPEEISLRQRLAEVYRQQGRQQEAIAQMDALGELLLDAGRMDEAVSTIRRIVNMNPPDVEGYRHLLKQLESGGR